MIVELIYCLLAAVAVCFVEGVALAVMVSSESGNPSRPAAVLLHAWVISWEVQWTDCSLHRCYSVVLRQDG